MPATASPRALLRRELAYAGGLAQAAGGALLFALPMFMTQEMWQLGAALARYRLVLFLLLAVPLLTGLTKYAGFKREVDWWDALQDALASYFVAFVVAGAAVTMLGVIEPPLLSLADLGTMAIQAVPAAFGAALAQSQLGGVQSDKQEERQRSSYWGELFLMLAGALFIAFNIAPTQEVEIITHGLTPWRCLIIVLVSLAMMHAFVYGLHFASNCPPAKHRGALAELLLYTMVGYVVSLLICLYMLWILGRLDGMELSAVLKTTVVLGFPASLGAAAARLII